MKALSKEIMETNDIQTYDIFPSNTIPVSLDSSQKAKIIPFVAPFLITVMTMTATPNLVASDESVFSQPVSVCQDSDFKDPIAKEAILRQFVSKMVTESIDIEPEFAEVANKHFKRFLW
jgi:hypothetical protein